MEDCWKAALRQQLCQVALLLQLAARGKPALLTFRKTKSTQGNHEEVILII